MSELIYPDAPGFKVSGPSEQAAEATGGTANKMRALPVAIEKAAAQRLMTASEYVRRSVIDRLKADGIDPGLSDTAPNYNSAGTGGSNDSGD
jgi:hypothetical protein